MKTLFSRKELSERWGMSVDSIIKYEEKGIISRVPKFDVPRYAIDEIEQIENSGMKISPLSPIERKRLERRIEQLESENLTYRQKLEQIKQLT